MIGARILRLESCTSTNDVVKDLAEHGEPEGTVVVSAEQTKGRGRQARSWFSSRNTGLYASLLLRPPGGDASLLTLMAGVALHQAVVEFSRIKVCLKWPNDLLWGGKKLGGILCEGSMAGSRMEFVVLGFGVNIGQKTGDFPPDLRQSAVSLRQITGADPDRDRLLPLLWGRLARWYGSYLKGHFHKIRTAFLERSCFSRGQTLQIETAGGAVSGLFSGIDAKGGLILEEAGKRKTYYAAEARALLAPQEI